MKTQPSKKLRLNTTHSGIRQQVLFFIMLFFIAARSNAQLTASVTIPSSVNIPSSVTIPSLIPSYNGTYDPFGQGRLYYLNGGEVRFSDDQTDASGTVKYHTMFTYPKVFLLNNNNLSLGYARADSTHKVDTLHRIDLEWRGSNSSAFLVPVDTQVNARLNYFTQWFGSAGRTNVAGSAAVVSQSIYNNIDLVYTSNNAGLVMYFIVYPGGNYKDIALHVNGSKANSIATDKLKIEANWEYTTFEKPNMYQYTISGNTVTPVAIYNASWQNTGTNTYQINNTNSYNSSLPLIIQIQQAVASTSVHTAGLNWSTYFGGWQNEFLYKTRMDLSDNLYVAGYSTSTNDFPQALGINSSQNNNGDGVIAKFDAAGVLQWSAFVGGSSTDEIHDFALSEDSIYCVGKTASSDLVPKSKSGATNNGTFGGGTWDGFIFQFNFSATGQLQKNWLTFYGGNGDEELNACKFDASGNFFVVGASSSTNMTVTGPTGSYTQTLNPAQLSSTTTLVSTDAIIAKFNTSSLQTWFTFYGTDALGTNANTYAADYFYDLTIDGTDVYVLS